MKLIREFLRDMGVSIATVIALGSGGTHPREAAERPAVSEIGARDILKLLAEKHTGDLFVPECKDGPTQSVLSFYKMDAWVLRKSWRHPESIGYEIKVARQDFLRDQKWRSYLPYCNSFYFVCPCKLIQPTEVPAGCGLIWTSVNGVRLYTKVKAPYREIEMPESVYRYVLICRSEIRKNTLIDSIEYWRDWLRRKEDNKLLGLQVGRRMTQIIKEQINDARVENARLRDRLEALETAERALRSLGLRVDDLSKWSVLRELEAALSVVPKTLIQDIERCLDSLKAFRLRCGEIEGGMVKHREGVKQDEE